ncbi:hypothetical protein GETHLI_01270 [Geothrix limicola]|uniref:Uncharacterized protein n=1 Tax=Geothrix limicola TaxID=2927978 RepID=A0ABQ5QB05_9BACT|nr:hypothetical protein [Geothrix limicola]GLH71625.1 hypothetical protein GETHLI_01270 [Geothrix limicola]
MRLILRAILTFALLLGGGVGDWFQNPDQAQPHECCCGMPSGLEDACPCPKPEGNRSPSRNLCSDRAAAVVAPVARRAQAERRVEPRPEPETWATAGDAAVADAITGEGRGRDPDLGRHLARLSTFRI